MPHVDRLFNQLQKRNIDSVYITGVIQSFTNSMHRSDKLLFYIIVMKFSSMLVSETVMWMVTCFSLQTPFIP